MSYYNTVNVKGEELEARTLRAKTQKEHILEIFKGAGELTPFDVQKVFPQWPITSIRRAISDLTREGDLVKTGNRKKGIYGHQNYTWKYAK